MPLRRATLFLFFALCAPLRLLATASYTQPMLISSYYPLPNTYYIAYFDFLSQSAQTVPNNSYLEYDVYLPYDSADYSGGVDFTGSNWSNLRDFTSSTGSYIRDQNYLRAHPFSDISPYAKGQWYHRKFDMGAAAGKSFIEACLTNDSGNLSNGAPSNLAGWYNAYFTNIKFTNAYGVTLLDLFSNGNSLSLPGSPVSSSSAFGGASAATALSNTVSVTQSLTLASAGSPAAANGLAAVTVTATFAGPGGGPVPGARVRFSSARSGDALSPTAGITDSLGRVTITVVSSLAGSAGVSAYAGPFSASTTLQFQAAAPTAWRLDVPVVTFVVGPSSTQLSVAAKDALGNVTGTSRSVVLSSADAQIELSKDGLTFSAAPLGITLSPSAGSTAFYVRITGGAYRSATLNAVDAATVGALSADSDSIVINPSVASGAALYLPSSGAAGAALLLSATALDGGGKPASSTAVFNLSSASSSGAFSQDNGYSWASTTTVAMTSGAFSLLYRDTKAGSSTVLSSSSLGSPSKSTTIIAAAASRVSGTASPAAVFNNAADGPNTSTLSVWVVDDWGNPVVGASVGLTVVAGGGGLSLLTALTDSSGRAQVVYTAGSTASNSNYIRATVAGLKPAMINVTASKPSRLNLSPNPATTGVSVATEFIILSQDASNPAITGYSTAAVRLSSTTSTLSFSADGSTGWGSSLDVTMADGHAHFFARDSSPTGAAGATITATDLSTSLATGISNVYIFQASLQVFKLDSVQYNVTQGEAGVSVTMTVRNQGGTDANLNASSTVTRPTFNGTVTGYSITPSPGNPTLVPAGGSVDLQFNITLSSVSPGYVTISGQVSGSDSLSGATLNDNGGSATVDHWMVAGPATQIRIYKSATTPVAGTPFSVTVVALDASNNTVSTFAQPLSVSARLNASPSLTGTGQVAVQWPSFVQGVASFNASYSLVEGVYLKALAGSFQANSSGITPVADALERYRVYNPPSVLLGAPFAVTVSAMDQFGNTRSGAVAVTLTANGGTGALTVAWKDLSGGLAAFFNEAYDLAQTIRIFASDGTVTSVLAETTPISIITYTATVTPTASPTATPSVTPTASPTATRTVTPSASPTATPSATPTASPTITPSATRTATPSVTPTASPTATCTATPSASPTATPSATPSSTPTASPSASPTASPSASPTATPTATATASPTRTATPSHTPTASPSASPTASPSASPTATPTATPSASPSATPSATASSSPTATPSASPTASPTASPSATPTASPTATRTASPTITSTASPTATATASPTITATATPTATSTASPTVTATATPTATATASPTVTPTASPTQTPTASPSATPTGSPTYTSTASPTASPSATPTASPTASPTGSPTWSPTVTGTATPTGSPTHTPTSSPTATPSATPTASPTITLTGTPTATPTHTPLDTATVTPTITQTSTVSPTPTVTPAFASSGWGRDVFAPNPVRPGDVVRLYFAAFPKSCQMVVFNLAGEVVARQVTGLGEQPTWDPQGMASGLYIAWVEITGVDGSIHRYKQKLALIF